jgi:hypothetical protein
MYLTEAIEVGRRISEVRMVGQLRHGFIRLDQHGHEGILCTDSEMSEPQHTGYLKITIQNTVENVCRREAEVHISNTLVTHQQHISNIPT